LIVWTHSFIELDLFDNNVPFDNITPIYLIIKILYSKDYLNLMSPLGDDNEHI